MTIVYISHPFFFDMDLSLVKEMFASNNSFFYLIDIPNYARNSTALNLVQNKKKAGIYPAFEFPEMNEFSDFLDLKRTFMIYRTSKKTYSWSNLFLQIGISKKIKIFKPDIIHCNNFLSFNFLYFLISNKIAKVITVHDPIPHSGESSTFVKIRRKANLLFFDSVILLNRKQSVEFIKATDFPSTKVYFSRLGAYTYLEKYQPKSENIKHGSNSILFFGRISPYKGVDDLLQAVDIIKTEIPDIQLILAGKGDFWFDISKYKNSKNFVFINRYITTPELVELSTKSKFIVCPYKDATQSGVVMTAFGLNKPVLATRVGGLSEMIEHDKTGILVDPNNLEELIVEIKNLLRNNKLLAEMEENIKYVMNHGEISWPKIASKLLITYAEIMSR